MDKVEIQVRLQLTIKILLRNEVFQTHSPMLLKLFRFASQHESPSTVQIHAILTLLSVFHWAFPCRAIFSTRWYYRSSTKKPLDTERSNASAALLLLGLPRRKRRVSIREVL